MHIYQYVNDNLWLEYKQKHIDMHTSWSNEFVSSVNQCALYVIRIKMRAENRTNSCTEEIYAPLIIARTIASIECAVRIAW